MPDLGSFQTLAPNVGANISANVAPTCVGNANVCACGERQRPANASNDGAPTRFPVSLDTGNVGTPRNRPQNHRLLLTILSSVRGLGWKNQFRPRSRLR